MKTTKILALLLCVTLCIVSLPGVASAVTPATGEEALFTTSTAPDVLILLDLSGSMAWNPAGDDKPWGHGSSCTADTTNCAGTGCTGGFCGSSKTGCDVDCSRLAIAKRSLFDILDDNDDNTITGADETSLGVRIGYMRYYNCGSDETDGDYTSGCIQIPGSGGSRRYINSKYSQIYCNSNTSCTVGSTGSYSIGGSSASGGTPLGSALSEAKIYLDAHKAADSAAACRQKFVLLVTDGSDTYSCGADGSECNTHRYKNRRKVVARAKALGDAGYRVFVIGFGVGMPSYLQNTLNWMSYYGRTDNPNVINSGSTTAYNIPSGCDISTSPVTNPTACCNLTTNSTACFPSGVTDCATDSAAVAATCYDSSNPTGISTSSYRASSDDPGYLDLSGYAFLASDADQLATALKTAMNIIREATYSFTQASVQSSRTADENYIYEASFEPISSDPFWHGHLKKYQITSTGDVGTMLLDAADVIFTTNASSRTIKTCLASTLYNFDTLIDKAYFGVSTDGERNAVVGYIRGETAYDPEVSGTGIYKLGDVFRSTPITVGTPSYFFEDNRDLNHAFATYRTNHCRATACSSTSDRQKRLILAGANDGQMHAFKTIDMSEAWSFIPPNLLPKLKNITHATHPTALTHQYFVDGPVTVADVWLGTGDGTSKSASDWKTVFIFGEGRGSTPNLWSSSQYCDSGFNSVYSTSFPYYCGYYAFNLTEPLSPSFMWILGGTSAIGATRSPYLGDPWSKVMPGKVKVGGNEKWVGFVGAGYNASDCSGGGSCDTRGKGFFVFDLSDGQILWSYTRDNDANMKYSLAGPAAVVDTDNDGFIDTAYIGGIGGSIWRFKFCTNAMGASCTTSNWTGGRLYSSSTGEIRPIYTMPAVAVDGSGNLWVYWGTGDKTDPTASNAQEKFYGLKDNDRTTTYTINDLDNISSSGSTYDNTNSTKQGYYMNLSGSGQKILADPTVFGGVVYFTTYDPASGGNLCDQGGAASIFGLRYTSGAGVFSGGARSLSLGTGIASAPIVSMGPGSSGGADLYVTVSGGGGSSGSTFRLNFNPPGPSNRTNILYWKDQRLQ
ncbi:MAG: PilC/PilY family type IV pilus protein [Syntrophaceae bacterium]